MKGQIVWKQTGVVSEWFKTKSGVQQNSLLSPTLIMTEICLEILKK